MRSSPAAPHRRPSGLLHAFDQVAAARDSRPCLIEIGDEQLEVRGVETVSQRCHVFELVERIVDRCVAVAPEAPAFLGMELVHRQGQMMRSIPLIEFGAIGFVRHLRANHEIGFPCLHARSSWQTGALDRCERGRNRAGVDPRKLVCVCARGRGGAGIAVKLPLPQARSQSPSCLSAATGRTFISARSESRMPSLRPLVWPSARALSHALWHGRSVRAQLLIVFIVIDVIAGLVAGAVTILQARASTRVEVAASMELAELLVSEAVALMQQEVPAEKFLADLSSQLRLVRHVRIVVKDAAGSLLWPHPPVGAVTRQDRVPAWFAALIAAPIASRDVPVVVNAARVGSVEIVAEPHDEIAEVWGNTVALGAVAFCVNVAVIGILYVLFGRVLDPLTGVARGLADLEQRNYRVRLPRPQAQELAAITDRFNALAQALEAARAENEKLNHRLITAQDDERRRTALELHDEVGPNLFGLKAHAASIATAAAKLEHQAARKMTERVRDMLAIIEQLQSIDRSMLNRLRPMALGHVPLRDILCELVRDRARQYPQIDFSVCADNLMRSYGDSVDLTIYRCVQESLTNIIRHAQAKHVTIELGEVASDANGGPQLALTVRDDGCGVDPLAAPGFGLRGMQERARALGGSCKVDSARGCGTSIRIMIPLRERRS